MALRTAIAAALNERSSFRLTDLSCDMHAVSAKDFSAYARTPVLWPIANDLRAVRRLFEALHAGVLPVLLPKTTASHKLAKLRQSYSHFGFFNGESIEVARAPVHVDDSLFMVLLTSGSTGEPKLLAVSEKNLVAGIRAIHMAQALADVSSTAIWLPLAYSYALINQLLWAVLFERRALMLPGLLDVPMSFARVQQESSAMVCMVAHQIRSLEVREPEPSMSLNTVQVLNFAGEPFPTSAFPYIRKLFPAARIYNNYGCTEAMPRLAVCLVQSAGHPATLVGTPIESVKIRIADESPVGPIEFQGASTSCGVLRADGGMEAHSQWIASGDLGRIEDGLLHVLGRYDQIVKAGGERFSLIEIEQAILTLGFTQAFVWQEHGHIQAVVSGEHMLSKEELTRQLRLCLPSAVWPARIVWIEQWPLLPSGKTDRTALQVAVRMDQLKPIFIGRVS